MRCDASRRQATADLFAIWWEKHRDRPVKVRDLDDDVKQAVDPQGRGTRQYLASQLEKLAGTRLRIHSPSTSRKMGRRDLRTY
jgi:hypothetical protein